MFIYINAEYELFYKLERGETHPDEGKPFSVGCVDWTCDNDLFCKSEILFTNPNGAPEDEVALVCHPDGAGIMMEWERPISMSIPLVLAKYNLRSGGFIVDRHHLIQCVKVPASS